MVCITALMDNLPSENKALVNEHGLSYLIQRGEERILFDCGAGEAPWRNAHKLGLSVSELDAVVLSHSHYDHAAGYCWSRAAAVTCSIPGPTFSSGSTLLTAENTPTSPAALARRSCGPIGCAGRWSRT